MGRLFENTTVNKKNPKHKIYCQEEYAQEAYDMYENFMPGRNVQPKDMKVGQISQATIESIDGNSIMVLSESATNIYLDYVKESKFMEKAGFSKIQPGMEVEVFVESIHKNNYYGSIEKAYSLNLKKDLLDSMKTNKSAYKATVKSINDGGFMVELSGLECFMPGSLAAANKVQNFESMLGKELMVMVETYLDTSNMFVVSNKKYIQHIIPAKIKELDLSKIYQGTVTGTVDYGVFIEWDDIFTGLLHESEITDPDWKNRKPGYAVEFYIKEIRDNNRIILSQKGPSPELKAMSEFKEKNEGQVVSGVVNDIKPFGAFIEMGDVTGLLPMKELRKIGRVTVGDEIDVFVKSVDTQSRKIYLRVEEA